MRGEGEMGDRNESARQGGGELLKVTSSGQFLSPLTVLSWWLL